MMHEVGLNKGVKRYLRKHVGCNQPMLDAYRTTRCPELTPHVYVCHPSTGRKTAYSQVQLQIILRWASADAVVTTHQFYS